MLKRALLLLSLAVALVLHQDFWLWHDARRIFGLPIGLGYHVLYCFAASLLMLVWIRFAWPEVDDE